MPADAGSRIKDERGRLGHSQAAFAKLSGVHRNTQIKYESGEREPDIAYLEAIAQVGVDVGYVLTGRMHFTENVARGRVFSAIESVLELTKCVAEETALYESAMEEVKADFAGKESGRSALDAARAWLSRSPHVFLDHWGASDLLERLEFVLETTQQTLTPAGKARAFLWLRRVEATRGTRIDLADVKEAIKREM